MDWFPDWLNWCWLSTMTSKPASWTSATTLWLLCSMLAEEGKVLKIIQNATGRLHVFVVPRQMVKPFNSDTVSVVANYARLPRHHQKALIGRTDENASYAAAMEQLVQLIQSEKPYFAPRTLTPEIFTASSSLSRSSHRNASGRSPGLSWYRLFTISLSQKRFCGGIHGSQYMPTTPSQCHARPRPISWRNCRC